MIKSRDPDKVARHIISLGAQAGPPFDPDEDEQFLVTFSRKTLYNYLIAQIRQTKQECGFPPNRNDNDE